MVLVIIMQRRIAMRLYRKRVSKSVEGKHHMKNGFLRLHVVFYFSRWSIPFGYT
jgi:hypothetical protein